MDVALLHVPDLDGWRTDDQDRWDKVKVVQFTAVQAA